MYEDLMNDFDSKTDEMINIALGNLFVTKRSKQQFIEMIKLFRNYVSEPEHAREIGKRIYIMNNYFNEHDALDNLIKTLFCFKKKPGLSNMITLCVAEIAKSEHEKRRNNI